MCFNIDKSNFISLRMIPGISLLTGIVRANNYNKKKSNLTKKENLNLNDSKVNDIIIKAICKDLNVNTITPEVADKAKKSYKELERLAICECIPLLNIWAVARSQIILKDFKKRCKITEVFEKKGAVHFSEFNIEKGKFEKFTLGKVFAEGGFGEVRKVTHCGNQAIEVLKLAKTEMGKCAVNDIENEYKQLRFLHQKGKRWGLQAAPRKFVKISIPDKVKANTQVQSGYLGIKYDNDYFTHLKINPKMSFKDYLTDFHQILSGAKQLDALNILHGDLKLANIFVKKDTDGTDLVHISDLGSSVNTHVVTDVNLIHGEARSYTPSYSPLSELHLSNQFAKNGNLPEVIEIEKKRDVFAIGVILYKALEKNNSPYGLDIDYHPITRGRYQIPSRISIPLRMIDLITDMLDPDYKKRPSASEAFDQFENILQTSYPDVLNQIQSKIQKEYLGSL